MDRKRRVGMVMVGALVSVGLGVGLTRASSGGGVPAHVDITKATAEYRPEGLALTVAVQEPVDPLADDSWSADGTFLSWELDTTGDGEDDYEVSYHIQGAGLTGEVTKTATESSSVVCPISAGTFTPAAGYTAVVDPSCLENPRSIAYRVTYYYQTDPRNDDAPVITDTAPDQGMTPMVSAP